jgi:hypothetical protein
MDSSKAAEENPEEEDVMAIENVFFTKQNLG